MVARRLLTVPACVLATLVLTALLPALLVLGAVATLIPGYRGALPTLLFVVGYLWCETLGLLAALYLWVRHRNRRNFLTANYRLQCWWTTSLKRLAQLLFRLEFDVHGAQSLAGAPALVLPRHASIADTILPMVFYAVPQKVGLRYVLKRELLADPCLDLVGNRLPNVFVDRDGVDTERACRAVGALTATLGPEEALLLYPEGTRNSVERRAALAHKHAHDPAMLAQLARWPDLLPPRLGGFLAMLEFNPSRDLVFCAHHGFEGSSHFASLVNGAWIGARVGIRFWRVPYAEIPLEREERVQFLFRQWDRMQQEVEALAAAGRRAMLQPSEVDFAG